MNRKLKTPLIVVAILIVLFAAVNTAAALNPSILDAISNLPLGSQTIFPAKRLRSSDSNKLIGERNESDSELKSPESPDEPLTEDVKPSQKPNSQPSDSSPPEDSCPLLSSKYATILEISDSLGHKYKQSEENKCEGSYQLQLWEVRRNQKVTIKVSANNLVSAPVLYQFVGDGFPNDWQTSNQVTVTFDDSFNVEPTHLRVFIKNSDELYRAPYYDDMIQVFFSISD